MFTPADVLYLSICLEAFLYGIYSGIFAIYLQLSFTRKEPKTTNVVFYALCLLYVLSTATFASDIIEDIIGLGILPPGQRHIDIIRSIVISVMISQITINGCCDFISQCILIYRCWIVWGKNIRVIIIPFFLAITYLATWLAVNGGIILGRNDTITDSLWGSTLTLTGLTVSMVVNALVTGLIVFKILKVFLEVKPTSVEQKLGSFSSTGGPKLRNVMFIIIESGMALFTIQLVRVVLSCLVEVIVAPTHTKMAISVVNALDVVIPIHQALNSITPTIILVRVQLGLSFDDEESFKETASGALGSLNFNSPPSDSDSDSLQGVGSMPPQERNDLEDIRFDNPPSDPNIILEVRRVPVESHGNTSSSHGTGPQERSEDT